MVGTPAVRGHGPPRRWLTFEELPHPNNRIMIKTAKSSSTSRRTKRRAAFGCKRSSKNLKSRRCSAVRLAPLALSRKRDTDRGTAHQASTIRFGRDPTSSALDLTCNPMTWTTFMWLTGAFLFRSTSTPLTIIANALRDHLKERLR